MASYVPVNPRPMLKSLIGKSLMVELKWGREYRGKLVRVDKYMNLQLSNSEEFIEGICTENVGEIRIRYSTISRIRDMDEEETLR